MKNTNKDIKKLLADWGKSKLWLADKNNEYKHMMQIYRQARENCDLPKAELVNYKAMAETMFRDICDKMHEKSRLDAAIEALDPAEKMIIIYRYEKKLKWERIPANLPMTLSLRQCYRLHKSSIAKLEFWLNTLY